MMTREELERKSNILSYEFDDDNITFYLDWINSPTRLPLPTELAAMDSNDIYRLGVTYELTGNTLSAIATWKMAADKGSEHAMINLGFVYRDQDANQAKQWFEKALTGSEKLKAKRQLLRLDVSQKMKAKGYAVEEGLDTLTDLTQEILDEHVFDCKTHAEMYNLAVCYELRDDLALATKYWHSASEMGSPYATQNLAKHYFDQKEFSNAIKYAEIAVQRGMFNSCLILAYCFKNTDHEKTLYWYDYGARKGEFNCMYELGILLLNDPTEWPRGLFWLNKSKEKFEKGVDQIVKQWFQGKNGGVDKILQLASENADLKEESIHLQYAPGGPEFEATQKQWNLRLGRKEEEETDDGTSLEPPLKKQKTI